MLAVIWDWFSNAAMFIYAVIATILAYYILKMYLIRRLIGLHINKRLLEQAIVPLPLDQGLSNETREVVQAILAQMYGSLDYCRSSIIEHANMYGTVLFKTSIYLPIKLTDRSLYEGMEIVKMMFYGTYKTSIRVPPPGRSEMVLTLCTTTGQDLTKLIERKPISKIVQDMEAGGYTDDGKFNGCTINLTMSIVTPQTKRGYDFRHYVA